MVSQRERVRYAVEGEEWQTFRKSLKGKPTEDKLKELKEYYMRGGPTMEDLDRIHTQVDNYLKALARGGQLTAPMSLEVALDHNWDLQILK